MSVSNAAEVQDTPTPDASKDQSSKQVEIPQPEKKSEETKPTEDQTKKPDQPKPEESKPEQKSVVPEKYDLKLPKNSLLNPKEIETLSIYAKEKGLSNEQAQEVLEQRNSAVQNYVEAQQELFKTTATKNWIEEIKSDSELGGDNFNQSAELAKRVVEKFGTDSFRKALSETNLGNHPELVRIFARIGKSMGDDSFVAPSGQSATKSKGKDMATMFYGETQKG